MKKSDVARLKTAPFRKSHKGGLVRISDIGICCQNQNRDYTGRRGLAAFATEVSKLLHWSPSSQLASVSGM